MVIEMSKRIAIITARGGSKRIPKKNIKEFCGKPIIIYSIEAAITSGLFDEVMVSTDDVAIADIARGAGAKVPFLRSGENASDFATTADVIMEVLDEYSKLGKDFDIATCIYPTAPFISADTLGKAISILENAECESVLPIVAFSFPPQRGLVIKEDRCHPKYPENMEKRSQDLEKMYHDAGQFYVLRVTSFSKKKKLVMDNTYPLILSEMQVQDIDTEEDWKIAELKYRLNLE